MLFFLMLFVRLFVYEDVKRKRFMQNINIRIIKNIIILAIATDPWVEVTIHFISQKTLKLFNSGY